MEQLKYIEVSDGYYKLAEAYSVNTRITGTNITLFDAGIELTEYGTPPIILTGSTCCLTHHI